MKKLLLLFSLLLSFSIQAQVGLGVSKNYPAHIVYKIDDIVSIVKLDENKQIKIAKKLQKIDSIANMSLAYGGSVDRLKSDYTIETTFLKNILSTEELERFDYEKNKENRFLAALNAITILKLQPEQVSKIRQLNDSLDTTPKKGLKETLQFQNKKLNKILDPKQYISLLRLIYKEQSIGDAKTNWERILNLKTNTPGKEKEEFQSITDYYLTKNGFLDKKADPFDRKRAEFFELKTNVSQPTALLYANILSEQDYTYNRFASLIQFKKELDLSQSQIDTILVKYKQLEKTRIENIGIDLKGNVTPLKPLPSEFEIIPKIVTVEQIGKWLVCKHRKESIKRGKESWYKLESEGLAKDLDKDKIIQDLSLYHLKYLVATDKSKFWKTPETQYLVRDVERTKPEVLQQLETITKSKSKNENAKNAMAW